MLLRRQQSSRKCSQPLAGVWLQFLWLKSLLPASVVSETLLHPLEPVMHFWSGRGGGSTGIWRILPVGTPGVSPGDAASGGRSEKLTGQDAR